MLFYLNGDPGVTTSASAIPPAPPSDLAGQGPRAGHDRPWLGRLRAPAGWGMQLVPLGPALSPSATTPIVAWEPPQALSANTGLRTSRSPPPPGPSCCPRRARTWSGHAAVDQRMYAQKTSARRSPERQTRDVLLRALQERNPELAQRHAEVARLVVAVAERMVLPHDDTPSCARRPSCTTSAKWASPKRSCTSRPRWMPRSGRSCAATPSSGSASSGPPRAGSRSQVGPFHPRTLRRQRLP